MKSRLRRRVLVSEEVSALFGFFLCFIGFFPLPWLYGPLRRNEPLSEKLESGWRRLWQGPGAFMGKLERGQSITSGLGRAGSSELWCV